MSFIFYVGELTAWIGIPLVCLAIFPPILSLFYPIYKFRSGVRKLVVDDRGVNVNLGDISNTTPWVEVADVFDYSGTLVIQTHKMCAAIIPAERFLQRKLGSNFETL